MAIVLLLLSALALLGAAVLWRADEKERAPKQPQSQAENPQQVPPPADPQIERVHPGVTEAPAAEESAQAPVQAPAPEPTALDEAVTEPASPAPPVPDPVPAEPGTVPSPPPEPAAPAPAELEPMTEPRPEPSPEPAPAVAPKPEATPAPATVPTPTPAPAPKPRASWKDRLPGAQSRARKELREWGADNGFTYAKTDAYLDDEWSRGAAASGAPARNVLTGTQFGHETRIAELGGVTVIGMGTGAVSEVVVDMRRGALASEPADDLVRLTDTEGFSLLASDAAAAERLIDVRVTTALELLPEQVSAVWFESEWVIAQLADATPTTFTPVFAPLALLADAARTLPPQHPAPLDLAVLQGPETTTREMGPAHDFGKPAETPAGPAVAPAPRSELDTALETEPDTPDTPDTKEAEPEAAADEASGSHLVVVPEPEDGPEISGEEAAVEAAAETSAGEAGEEGDEEGVEDGVVKQFHPTVVRPEEPLEMPTRMTGGVRGPMEYRTVGGDEVAPIGEGGLAPKPSDGTRITRRTQPPSIFQDAPGDASETD